jgi:cell division septal protein FtsQ
MRPVHSYCNFKQHKPQQSWWQKIRHRNLGSIRPAVADQNLTNDTGQHWPAIKRPTKNQPFAHKKNHLLSIIVLALFLIWAGVILYLPYFRVTNINISGLKIISESEMRDDISNNFVTSSHNIWPRNNYFLINTGKIADFLQNKYQLSGIQITKEFPYQLNIVVEEKISSIIVNLGDQCVLLDNSGTVLKQLDLTKNIATTTTTTTTQPTSTIVQNLPRVSSTLEVADFTYIRQQLGDLPIVNYFGQKENTFSASYISKIISLFTEAKKQGIGHINYFVLSNPLDGVNAFTGKPWFIMFNLTDQPITQINKIKAITKDNKPTQYIDVRYQGRVYWK